MKRGLLFLSVFFILMSSVYALEIDHEIVQGEALPGNEVSHKLFLRNNEQIRLDIELSSPDLNWILDKEDYKISLDPDESRTIELSFKPLAEEKAIPGHYGIRIFIDTQSTRIERILPAKVLKYSEVLSAEFSPAAQIDPRRGAILRLFVQNNKNVVLEDLNLEITSQHFQFTRTFSLGKKESINLEFPVKLDPDTVMGDYQAEIKVILGSNTLVTQQLPYKVQEYEDLKEIVTPSYGFLTSSESVLENNEGNIQVSTTVARQFGWLSYKFTSFSAQPSRVTENEEGFLVEWDINLQPKEQLQLEYTTNYRLLAAIILIIILALVAWYVFRKRNAIVLDKRVLAMHTETGSVRVVKIILNARNRGNMPVSNLRVVDRVPSVIKAPTQYGSLKPMHVKAAPEGTTMVWDFAHIRPREEKIISYRLEGKIQVLGRIVLPSAIAKYIMLGRGITARSQTLSLREKK